MQNDPGEGLNEIWPRVREEIASARRGKARRLKAWRVAAALGPATIIAGLLLLAPRWPEKACGGDPWQLTEVNSATGICTDYPLVRDDRILAVQGQGIRQRLACIDKRTGQIKWRSQEDFFQCRIAADTLRVYLLAKSEGASWRCSAFQAETGRLLWRHSAADPAAPPPSILTVVRKGLCWSEGNLIVMRESRSGELRWRRAVAPGSLLSAPVEDHAALFVASHDHLFALHSDTGEWLWHQRLRGGTTRAELAQPMVQAGGNRVFIAARNPQGNGILWCLATETREVLWTRHTPAPTRLRLAEDRLFVRSQALSAFEVLDGTLLWEAPVSGCGNVYLNGDRVYLVDAQERLLVRALDGRTGKTLENWTSPGSCNGVVVSGCMGFLSGNDRVLYAFRLDERS